ncbi:hypothetical protein ACFFGR_09310 [Arthrobacter liuii]|uniref:Uncharacterized protein n=1 Tax=Arthrobacter liuii TaxID=1476996 RepID=A0ABQ2AQ85_9MICC|nr:hypothetical protein [Arthrobacter liuii]GGH93826.1 hypothetical protein GCM10007170_15600 [Arthrobacter liuii]
MSDLTRSVEESGQAYINALVNYHHALKKLEDAQHQVAIERGLVEAAHERNESWLRRRAAHVGTIDAATLAELDVHDRQARDVVEQ